MIKTERLSIRKITFDDAVFIQQLVNSEGWLQFIGDRNVVDQKSAEQFIQRWAMDRYATYGYGPYLVLLDDETIGVNGLFKRDYLEHPDLGFAFLPDFIGFGYARESSEAVVNYASQLGFKKLGAITLPENKSSQKLLTKLGFEEKQHPKVSGDVYFELLLD